MFHLGTCYTCKLCLCPDWDLPSNDWALRVLEYLVHFSNEPKWVVQIIQAISGCLISKCYHIIFLTNFNDFSYCSCCLRLIDWKWSIYIVIEFQIGRQYWTKYTRNLLRNLCIWYTLKYPTAHTHVTLHFSKKKSWPAVISQN